MADIVQFPDKSDEIVQLLLALAQLAKSGEIVCVAVVDVRRGGEVGTVWAGADDCYHQLHSGVQRLAHRIAATDD